MSCAVANRGRQTSSRVNVVGSRGLIVVVHHAGRNDPQNFTGGPTASGPARVSRADRRRRKDRPSANLLDGAPLSANPMNSVIRQRAPTKPHRIDGLTERRGIGQASTHHAQPDQFAREHEHRDVAVPPL